MSVWKGTGRGLGSPPPSCYPVPLSSLRGCLLSFPDPEAWLSSSPPSPSLPSCMPHCLLIPCPPPFFFLLNCLQVLNDLLDPSRTNLKVLEDSARGVVVVEGLSEVVVASAEEALAVVAMGDTHRKVRRVGG